ncbi:amidohydrolase family protein [Dyadobacter arcticus]|uniref:Imidazolonepropionase-like amidohydrolase n=1 Tax=Dyadobacter arcticus TaxID=1078754 RepID=A0ABX0UPY6_9BACT|nr:amidohydrolase family protein [Dyadobacter arcticus]NIJ53740.1 imidazolonepropionase-like amidohydrolase [Dyadobacter arcticus]
MNHYLSLFLCAIALTTASAQSPVSNADREIVFKSVNVIPMDRETVLRDQTVVIKNGKITALGDDSKVRVDKGALIVDAKGKYLTPGWSEMHAHVPAVDDLAPMKEVLMLYLVNGITTIRGMLGNAKHLELREKVRSGEILGPNFYTTGPAFSGQTVKTAARGIEMVKEEKAAGYDYLKLLPGLTKETFPGIAKTSAELGIPMVGHVSFAVGVWAAIDAGYSTIDHLDGFVEAITPGIDTLAEQETGLFSSWTAYSADTSKIPKLIKALKEKNIRVVPTQAIAERWLSPSPANDYANDPDLKYMKPEDVKNWMNAKNTYNNNPKFSKEHAEAFVNIRRKLILACQKGGVQLLLGCDAPQVLNVPGFATHHEMKYLTDAGLTPYEALKTGTVNVAEYLKKMDSGVVKIGNVSDLVLLNGNPLEDIGQTKNIEGVMIGTKWLPKTYLQSELKKLEKR